MQTLTINISENEYAKFGLKGNTLLFSDFVDIVGKELTRQNLDTQAGRKPRKAGFAKGTVRYMADDFNETPPDFKDYM